VGLLAIGSPMFGRTSISLPNHRRAVIRATAYTFRRPKGAKKGRSKPRKVALSAAEAPYVRSMSFNGHAYGRPWTTYCALARGARLSFQLGPDPNRKWGDSAAAVPPSFGPNRQMPTNACTP
jgi:putative alpha-1,2-mannosidase